jgi:hypothetical protein
MFNFILNILNDYSIYLFSSLFTFFVWQKYNILIVAEKNTKNIDFHEIQSIPNGFTTLGVFGTFWGILLGLLLFKVENIEASVPALLSGMKTAFVTSVAGLLISMYFNKRIKTLFYKLEQAEKQKESPEMLLAQQILNENKQSSQFLSVLQGNSNLFKDFFNKESFEKLSVSLAAIPASMQTVADNLKTSVEQQTNALTTAFAELVEENKVQTAELGKLKTELAEIKNNTASTAKGENNSKLISSIEETNKTLLEKFDAFAKSMAEQNMNALVEGLKKVVTDFNATFQNLIKSLVSKNFEELNKSVIQLNEWQQNNVVQVEKLTLAFNTSNTQLTEKSLPVLNNTFVNLEKAAQDLNQIVEFEKQLVGNAGLLQNLTIELKKVMQDDTKFDIVANNLFDAAKKMSEAMQTLKNWQQIVTAFNNSATKLDNSAVLLEQVSNFENQLIGDAGDLKRLITELQQVMSEDRNLVQLVLSAGTTATTLQNAAISLNTTATNYQNIGNNINGLGDTLGNIKTNVDLFTAAFIQMRDGLKDVTTVRLNDINEQFLANLNGVFTNLDRLFARYTDIVNNQINNRR